jgi:hypothetical protein
VKCRRPFEKTCIGCENPSLGRDIIRAVHSETSSQIDSLPAKVTMIAAAKLITMSLMRRASSDRCDNDIYVNKVILSIGGRRRWESGQGLAN